MAIKKSAKRPAKKKAAKPNAKTNAKNTKSKLKKDILLSPPAAAASPVPAAAILDDRILNCTPSREQHLDWSFADRGGLPLAAPSGLPMDLRETWWSIQNQGKKGACVGWALADSIIRWLYVKYRGLDQNVLLSPRFLWMAAKETDDYQSRPETFIETTGTSLKAAMDIARKYGCVTNAELPINSGSLYEGEPNSLFVRAASFKIARYFLLSDFGEWDNWLKYQGPILIRVEVDSVWNNASRSNPNLDYYEGDLQAGHAAAIVGKTSDGRYIIRNSWGEQWGEDGFAYASQSYAEKAFSEVYGIEI